ncbi:MAG TPA: c-type cytochrome [Xanthobacteraceae bacterium]|nr:c-type cytochrome [Xanthobacteraceae bacterium]
MTKTFIRFAILALLAGPASAAEELDWAYPVTPKPEPLDNVVLKQMPGSTRQYTQAQIDDPFNAPDWYPDDHPPMPPIVAHGKKPAVQACARCHLPSGDGHPESSSVAGLPVAYTIRQMAAFRNGERKGIRTTNMAAFAKAMSDEDVRAAAEYFAALKPGVWTKVIETDTVPKTFLGAGAMRFVVPEGGSEPTGNRIIVVPQDAQRAHSRDARSGFIDYVPSGSIAKGEALVATGAGGKTIPCAICHGAALKGLGEVPAIAGRPPIYVVRQLHDMQTGNRSGSLVELMKAVVAKLTVEDMVAIAAYLGSREP